MEPIRENPYKQTIEDWTPESAIRHYFDESLSKFITETYRQAKEIVYERLTEFRKEDRDEIDKLKAIIKKIVDKGWGRLDEEEVKKIKNIIKT